jgi:hypothetical protein
MQEVGMGIAVMPLISSLISLIFALAVLDQFFARRKPYQLVWALGLLMYFVSTGMEFWAGWWGLNETVYRIWYLVGAVCVAAYLGMGTIYLLVRRRIAHIVMILLIAASVYAAVRVSMAEIDLNGFQELSGKALPRGVRLLTPFFNTFGTVALVGGAIYSAWVYWRRRTMGYRVVSNVLIAVGAILPAFGGLVMRLWDTLAAFYLLEMLGVIIIFIGFRWNRRRRDAVRLTGLSRADGRRDL